MDSRHLGHQLAGCNSAVQSKDSWPVWWHLQQNRILAKLRSLEALRVRLERKLPWEADCVVRWSALRRPDFSSEKVTRTLIIFFYTHTHTQSRSKVQWRTQRARKFKKIPGIKLMKSIFFLSWNCISGSFKLFPSSKIEGIGSKKIFVKLIYFIFHKFFWPGLF